MCTWLPMPAEPKLIVCGFAFALSTSSFSVFASLCAGTTTTIGPLDTSVIGTKSFTASKPVFL